MQRRFLEQALLVIVTALLAGCGALGAPTPARIPTQRPVPLAPSAVPGGEGWAPVPSEVAPAPPPLEGPDSPPLAAINGVEGVLVSFCWKLGCADGVPPAPDGLPAVGPPLELELPDGASVEGVTAWNGVQPNPRSLEVPFDGSAIGELPDGTAMLNVFVRFEAGGDASYFWAYAASAASASAQP